MKKHLLFLGAPGAGKGTQAELLSQTNSYLHLSTGELLRKEIEMNTTLGIQVKDLSLIHISEPTRPNTISYAVFCL